MKSSFLTILICMLATVSAVAKDGEWKRSATVKEYRVAMKEKRYDAARKVIDTAIDKHAEAKADPQLYSMRAAALSELISAESRKIYLNQRPDTTQYFKLMLELYSTGMACDSIEQAYIETKVAEGKKVAAKYGAEIAARTAAYRSKLVTAGKYFYTKRDYATAFKFFQLHLTPQDDSQPTDSVAVSALATLSAYGSDNHQAVMDYLPISLKDKSLSGKLLEIGSKSAAMLGDTIEMVNLLENGFYSHPETDYFFLTLVKHYNSLQQYPKALAKAERITTLFPQNRDYLFIRGKEEMLVQQLDSAISSFRKCVEIKPDDADSYSALGNVYLQKARDLYASQPSSAQAKKDINAMYEQAAQAFEGARQHKEDEPSLWLEGLREAYFNLNKGKELKALDKAKH